jgi:type VI secretion system protein ImpH
MPTTQRQRHAGVIQRLLDEPYRFELIQALRMLELWLGRHGVSPNDTFTKYIRFENSVSMDFPASQIEALAVAAEQVIDSDSELQAALESGQLKRICITPAFMGFLGVSGVMPSRYTEDVADQIHLKKYEGTRAFFDIFSNRIMALYYQAWAKYRIQYCVDARGKDVLLPIQLALAGRAFAAEKNDAEVGNEVAAYYAAMVRHRPAAAPVIAGVLSEYFGVPIQVQQFIGRWDPLRDSELFKLGVQNGKLSHGMIIGRRRWERHARLEIRIGPLSRAQFDQFIPGASGYQALKAMLRLFSIAAIEFEIRLVLRAQDVRQMRLGDPASARVGMGMFLITKPGTKDRDDVVYAINLNREPHEQCI